MSPLILLAGGRGSRMGQPKGLLEFQNRKWLDVQLARFQNAGGTRALVVLGFSHDEYFATLPWTKRALATPIEHEGLRLSVAVNSKPELGQFSSIQCGIAALASENPAALFLLPVDVPAPAPELWQKLSDALRRGISVALPRHAGQGGHPVLLSKPFLAQIQRIPLDASDARLDAQIRNLPTAELADVDTHDTNVVTNLNTLEAWQGFKS